ncbi:MAG TPA: helicase-related protein [Candidatus Saccharimonadales bacterium]
MLNSTLPIYALREQITNTILENPVTIVVTETGAGKSTQIPQMLLMRGCRVVVTQPKRFTAKSVAERVAEEYGTPIGEVVGYKVGTSEKMSADTRCLFITNGLSQMDAFTGSNTPDVLIIDELHEFATDMDVLLAWTRERFMEGANFKLVIMSATIESDRLSAFFGGAPIINVPGRPYEVKQVAPQGRNMVENAALYLKQGRGVLVFQPGKEEISEFCAQLEALKLNVEILPFHGDMTDEEQESCRAQYNRPVCIVATNGAQTGATFPNVSVVIDSGMERREEVVNGISGLYLRPISLVDAKQRMGRVGRTEPGIYVDWCLNVERPEFPVAELLRVRLTSSTLRLAVKGIDIERLKFFHQPDASEILAAKQALNGLGCLDKHGRVTQIGRRVAKLPLDVEYGRMVVAADELGVLDDVVTIAAILNKGGVIARVCDRHKGTRGNVCRCGRQLAGGEDESDPIAHLNAFRAVEAMINDPNTKVTNAKLREMGIFAKRVWEVRGCRKHIIRALRMGDELASSGDRGLIMQAIAAGMINHLHRNERGLFLNGNDAGRELSNDTVMRGMPAWVVGEPYDLEIKLKYGSEVKHLLRMATPVVPEQLMQIAPHLVEVREGVEPRYDAEIDGVMAFRVTMFDRQVISAEWIASPDCPEAPELLREGRNARQWAKWVDRPEIALPDLLDPAVEIPGVARHTYGNDAVTGEPLVAYGVVVRNLRQEEADSLLEILWTQSAEEAEEARQQTLASLPSLVRLAGHQAVWAERARCRQEREAAAAPLVQEAVALYSRAASLLEDQDLRMRLYHATRFMVGYDAAETAAWMTAADLAIVEAGAALREAEKQRDSLRAEALSLRDKVNGLLVQHKDSLGVFLYDELAKLDIDDDLLPSKLANLREWVETAKGVIASAGKRVLGVSPVLPAEVEMDALADMKATLAGRFNVNK